MSTYSAGAIGAAIHARRRQQMIQRFQEMGATTVDKALDLKTLGVDHSRLFDSMVYRGVIRPASDGRYFLDTQAWERFNAARRTAALVFSILLAGLAIFLLAAIKIR